MILIAPAIRLRTMPIASPLSHALRLPGARGVLPACCL